MADGQTILGPPPRGPQDTSGWIHAGPASSFLDLEPTGKSPLSSISQYDNSTLDHTIPCKILRTNTSPPVEIPISDVSGALEYKDQVLIFRYRGKFHAIDHQCPHMSHPLSQGTVYDIEDFGIKLSVGIECSKHRWAFDLFTGESTRGSYRLKIWEVQLRDSISASDGTSDEEGSEEHVKEVWVRRQRRMG